MSGGPRGRFIPRGRPIALYTRLDVREDVMHFDIPVD